ncbi:AbiU2 domain-containing protein [Pseudomonas synxantha]|uniref:AbiU2 domain-containing protein n=1 Tax=Pseudomonas synxantha TaxID=47883 RepID=UPI000F584DD1|nr:hypothetical protein [Pseudomonas synxantha]AZE65624.1 hypothetical protein C4K01_1412 [Pseudomonas synxantha]
MEKDVRKDIEVFISNAVASTRQVQLFEQLFTDERSSVNVNKLPETFSILKLSMLKAVVLGICAFFDPEEMRGDKNLSINYIRKKYRSRLSPSINQNIRLARALYNKLNISKYRSKYLAHYDVDHFTKVAAISHDITTEDLQELLLLLMKIGLAIDGVTSPTAEQLFNNSRLRSDDCGYALIAPLGG